ncbi:MAG: phosphatidylglycerol lysyltransferase domain-containing protein [Bacillota bacterium]
MSLEFKQVVLEMKPMVERYRAPWKLETSEYTFTNLFIWGTDGRIEVAEREDALFTKLTYGNEKTFMFAPLPADPNADYARLIRIAEEYFEGIGVHPRFVAIAPQMAELIRKYCPAYELKEDRDNFDYVYLAQDLMALRGKKFHSKRNHINQFRLVNQFEYVRITPDMFEECMHVYANWLNKKDMFERGVIGELNAVRAALKNMETLSLKGGGIRIGGNLAAFTLGERITPNTALIHIEKADAEINGLYAMINQQFVEHEWSDMEFINREEDMGLEGLRKAKLSYYPAKLIQKYEAKKRV